MTRSSMSSSLFSRLAETEPPTSLARAEGKKRWLFRGDTGFNHRTEDMKQNSP